MIKRILLKEIEKWIGDEKILIIKGARQVGKTTLMKYLQDQLKNKNEQTVYFSIDTEKFNPVFETPKKFLNFLENQYIAELPPNKKLYLFLDEFQYLKEPGLFLKNIFDTKKEQIQIIVSGSSSLEISKAKEFLTGRKIDFYLSRFSFQEMLLASSNLKYSFSWKLSDDFNKLSDFFEIYQQDLRENFQEYLNWGGYPEVVTTKNYEKKEIILQEIINTYIQKDVADFLKIENISGFNKLIITLSSQIGNLINKDKISNILDLNSKTVTKYLDILEGTFIFTRVQPFFTNFIKSIVKTPKIFIEDLGISKIMLRKKEINEFDEMSGAFAENFVYSELCQKFNKNNISFFRTRNGAEIDFIIQLEQNEFLPIEVKYQNRVKDVPVAVTNFLKNEKIKTSQEIKAIIITKNKLELTENNILFLPITLLPFLEI